MATAAEAIRDPRVRKILEMRGVAVAALPEPPDDPDRAECDARAAEIRAGKTAALADGEPPGRWKTRGLAPRACASCGAEADASDRWCPGCGLLLDAAPALKSVTPPAPRAPKKEEPPLPKSTPAPATPSPNGTAATWVCPECHEPVHSDRKRCYKCHPGIPKGGMRTVDGESPPARTLIHLDADAPAPPRPKVTRPHAVVPFDPEVSAIARVLDALDGLDAAQLRRVLDYVGLRVHEKAGE